MIHKYFADRLEKNKKVFIGSAIAAFIGLIAGYQAYGVPLDLLRITYSVTPQIVSQSIVSNGLALSSAYGEKEDVTKTDVSPVSVFVNQKEVSNKTGVHTQMGDTVSVVVKPTSAKNQAFVVLSPTAFANTRSLSGACSPRNLNGGGVYYSCKDAGEYTISATSLAQSSTKNTAVVFMKYQDKNTQWRWSVEKVVFEGGKSLKQREDEVVKELRMLITSSPDIYGVAHESEFVLVTPEEKEELERKYGSDSFEVISKETRERLIDLYGVALDADKSTYVEESGLFERMELTERERDLFDRAYLNIERPSVSTNQDELDFFLITDSEKEELVKKFGTSTFRILFDDYTEKITEDVYEVELSEEVFDIDFDLHSIPQKENEENQWDALDDLENIVKENPLIDPLDLDDEELNKEIEEALKYKFEIEEEEEEERSEYFDLFYKMGLAQKAQMCLHVEDSSVVTHRLEKEISELEKQVAEAKKAGNTELTKGAQIALDILKKGLNSWQALLVDELITGERKSVIHICGRDVYGERITGGGGVEIPVGSIVTGIFIDENTGNVENGTWWEIFRGDF